MISPVSSPWAIYIMVTPVSFSPLRMAQLMGAAPRYLGSREEWTFTHPSGGSSKISTGKIRPYAATTIISGFSCRSVSNVCPSLSLSG